MTRRKQKSCHQCRSRHLKCDGQQPCMHCRRGARECSKDDDHIFLNESNIGIVRRRRKYSLSFGNDQTWMNLPSSVTFADARASSSSEALSSGGTTPARHNGSVGSQRSCSPPPLSYSSEPNCSSSIPLDPTLELSLQALQQPLQDLLGPNNTGSSFIEPGSSHDVLRPSAFVFDASCHLDSGKSNLAKPPTIWPHQAQWPFTTYQEGLLVRHYVSEIAPWWDIIDGGSHFSTTVVELAATSPALLSAILALAAKHLSLMGKLDESVCLRYSDTAYQALLPDLSVKAYEGENLAAVLLLCQVFSLNSGQPCEEYNIHLGLDIFMAAWQANSASSLHAQLFFSVLRMHFHHSFYSGDTMREIEANCDWMWPALNSFAGNSRLWACRVELHAARCLNYVSDTNGKTWERWIELKKFSDVWRLSKPGYFDPVFQQDPLEGDPFPTRIFASALFAGTHQFFALARMLLFNNQPRSTPPASLDIMRLSSKEVEQESRLTLRKIMGTALHHMDSIPVVLASVVPITYGGHILTDRITQEYAYNILELAQKNAPGVVPPKEFVRLRKVWGWDEEVVYQNVL